LIALNEAMAPSAAAASGCACQGGAAPTLAPQATQSCSTCDAGQSGIVFDSCHLGDACDGDDCCDGCPTWCIRGGTVIFQRQRDVPRALVAGPPPIVGPAPTLLDASNFAYPMRGGPDIDIIHHGSYFDIEVRYFAVDEISADAGPTAVAGPGSLLYAIPIAFGVPGGTALVATDVSQLRSIEVNLRKEVAPGWLTLLMGYRHFELNEQLSAAFALPGGGTTPFSVQAFNRMDGFQVGGEAVLWRPGCGRFRLEGDAKVGVFGDGTSNFGSVAGVGTATATGTHTAFMAEWGITGVVQITPHLGFRAGYQGFVLDGVALASEQIGVLNPIAGTGATENSGTPVYHGLVANLEYCW
jgi:hypothetical protein